MTIPTISVIMPVFNAERYIHEAIESILNQTFTDYEFIIINDGSSDETQNIILRFQDPRIKLFNNDFNMGLVFSLNKGIRNAKGKYIARMDADDISLPHRLEIQVNYLNSNQSIGVVGSNCIYINQDGVKGDKTNLPIDNLNISWLLFFSVPIAHPTVMMHASVLDFTNGYDSLIVTTSREKYSAEDYNLWIRLLDFTMFANIDEPLLLYRVHNNNVSYVNSKETVINGILIDFELIKKLIYKKIDIKIVECLWLSNFSDVNEIIQTIALIIDLLLYHINKYGNSLSVSLDGFKRINSICLGNKRIIENAADSDIKTISQLICTFNSILNKNKKYLNKSISILYFQMSCFSFKRIVKLNFLYISLWIMMKGKVYKNIQLFKTKLNIFRRKNYIIEKFTNVYLNNSFQGTESISGPGSGFLQTQIIRNSIPQILKKYNIKSFIDGPCGDYHWMKHVDIGNIKYIGIDIVEVMIKENKIKYETLNRNFICKNIVSDKLPDADLILIRDCWVHLSNSDILLCINNLSHNKIKYLLTTSFTNRSFNKELDEIWRPLNLELPPFNFPPPIEIINEHCTENDGIYSDKSLLLWEISSLPNI